MSKYNYDSLKGLSIELINKFGSEVILEKPDGSQYTGEAVFDSVSEQNRPEDLTKQDIRRVLLSINIDNEPELGDLIIKNNVAYAVETVDIIQPAETVLLYELIVGK